MSLIAEIAVGVVLGCAMSFKSIKTIMQNKNNKNKN